MTKTEQQIWDLVHEWCNEQSCEIPDFNRRVLMERILALRQPLVSGSLPSIDPLDDENSEIHKIGREIAEMSDDEFEANCKEIEKMLKGSKGNDR